MKTLKSALIAACGNNQAQHVTGQQNTAPHRNVQPPVKGADNQMPNNAGAPNAAYPQSFGRPQLPQPYMAMPPVKKASALRPIFWICQAITFLFYIISMTGTAGSDSNAGFFATGLIFSLAAGGFGIANMVKDKTPSRKNFVTAFIICCVVTVILFISSLAVNA